MCADSRTHITKAVKPERHQILTIIGGVTQRITLRHNPGHRVHDCGNLIG